MFAQIQSASVLGVDCVPITVEVDMTGSWPGYQIVGLPDAAIKEAKERIRTAWKNTGLTFPSNSRVIINLAPADVRKEGASFDLPMALGLYLASEDMQSEPLRDALFVGELALDGSLRATPGVLPLAVFAKACGYRRIFVPESNAREACVISGIEVYPVKTFRQLLAHVTGLVPIPVAAQEDPRTWSGYRVPEFDMAFVRGQEYAKRALEIAAAGAHNILLSGPPGSGKTLLARTLPGILPALTMNEAIDVTKIYSVSGLITAEKSFVIERPFRAPHHSASMVSLVGGGKFPKPGEISLAHRGVLFLDEFSEFPRMAIDALRQPLEDGIVTISRAQHSLTFPARFMLVASHNPCPCGYRGDLDHRCVCTSTQIANYHKKVSGPILDRIDLHITIPRVPFAQLSKDEDAESSSTIRVRVEAARERQMARFSGTSCITNSDMKNKEIKQFCNISDASVELLRQAMLRLHLSARSYHRVLKLSRTIADLAGSEHIETSHVSEALQYRIAN